MTDSTALTALQWAQRQQRGAAPRAVAANRVGLGSADLALYRRHERRPFGCTQKGVILISRQSHSSQNTNNRHNDHQFDQGKTLLHLQVRSYTSSFRANFISETSAFITIQALEQSGIFP
jgi:hypothetical protein